MTDTTATDTTATDTASIAPTSTTAAALSRIRSSTWARPEDGPVDPQTLLNIVDALAELESLDEQLEKLIEIMSTATVSDRASLFLYDKPSDELYIRAAHGGINELRLPSNAGIVGHVFSSGESVIIRDVYADERFYQHIDKATGYKTKSILCTPVKTRSGETLGVAQCLNRLEGIYCKDDLDYLDLILRHAALVLQGTVSVNELLLSQQQEAEFLDVVSEISSEIQLGPLLQLIMAMVTKMLHAERSTLFLNDEKTGELFTEVGEGLGATRIRFKNNQGIAGTVFQSGVGINIPYAYADLRFNPQFDTETGFFTRSLLCVPVKNKLGTTIGVTQVLNKIGGTFTTEDQTRLNAFTAQISIALQNAKLFDDMQSIKNYNDAILQSMSNGVITVNDKQSIVTWNKAALKILGTSADQFAGESLDTFFGDSNAWLVEKVKKVETDRLSATVMDAEINTEGVVTSVNVSIAPLKNGKGEPLGTMMLLEDISTEKRVKSTMARYMDPGLADKIMESGEDLLGGQTSFATVLFSDIRSFTTITEELGAQGTVALLNDYFTIMVEVIQSEGGMLDKFIGDAVMAIYGTPFTHDDDPDRGVRAAIRMMQELAKFNRTRIDHGLKPIDIGIGVNSGDIVSGNIGSPKRMDYTVIGDGVNLAARLESACKQYGTNILISEFTFEKLRGTYRTREVDAVVVKGKTEPVRIYDVLDFHTEESFPSVREVTDLFRDGLQQYRQGNWDTSIDHFNGVLKLHPHDKAAQLYLERCRRLKENPPEDWDGISIMTSK